jgi:uncharacterized glyoxalase superfamily protein PhnB
MQLTRLTPTLESTDLRATLQFYTEVLGFHCADAYPDAAQPCWLSLRNGDIELMFCERNQHRREFSASAEPLLTGSLYFNPADVSALWEELKDKVTVEYPLADFDYGMREFGIRDCNGYLLQFGQELPAA